MPRFILRLQPISLDPAGSGREEREVSVIAESPADVVSGNVVPPGFTLVSWRRAGAPRAAVESHPATVDAPTQPTTQPTTRGAARATAPSARTTTTISPEVERVARELMETNSIEWEVALTAATEVVRIRETSARRYRSMNGFTD